MGHGLEGVSDWHVSMGHGSTSHAHLARANRTHKPIGHVTPGENFSPRILALRLKGGKFHALPVSPFLSLRRLELDLNSVLFDPWF